MIRIDHRGMRRLATAIFAGAGCSAAEAARIADSLTEATLTGHESHGVIRVPRYVGYVHEKLIFPDQSVTTVTDGGAFAVLDGNFGFGQTVGPQATRFGIERAARGGVAIIALRRAGHLGRIGEYAAMAAEAGLISVHFVNVAGSSLVAPAGGVERRFSTAPIAIGVPMKDAAPLILDFATSRVAEGKVLVAQQGGKKLPEGSLIAPDGKPGTDPAILYGIVPPGAVPNAKKGPGALMAMGEHKGSGLALICELLGGALTGSGMSGPAEHPGVWNGMLSIYMQVGAFAAEDAFAAEVRGYVEWVRSAKPAEPGAAILLPGEPERISREARIRDGIPFTPQTWEAIRAAGLGVGLSGVQIDALATGD